MTQSLNTPKKSVVILLLSILATFGLQASAKAQDGLVLVEAAFDYRQSLCLSGEHDRSSSGLAAGCHHQGLDPG